MLCANEARRGAEGEGEGRGRMWNEGRQEERFRSDEIQYTLTRRRILCPLESRILSTVFCFQSNISIELNFSTVRTVVSSRAVRETREEFDEILPISISSSEN